MDNALPDPDFNDRDFLPDTGPNGQTVMIVDDQHTGRQMLADILKTLDKTLHIPTFATATEALAYVEEHPVDLVITDYKMPQANGLAMVQQLRKRYTYQELPILMVTAIKEPDLRQEAYDAGVTDFLVRPLNPTECLARCRNLLTMRFHYTLHRDRLQDLEEKIDETTRGMRLRDIDTLLRLTRLMEARDDVTGSHLRRVADYAMVLAPHLPLAPEELDCLRLAAPMHDIGKLAIPDTILKKEGELTTDEFAVMQTHTHVGHSLLKGHSSFLKMAADIALYHHEHYDGSGYPGHLKGEDIPQVVRLIAVVDVFDTLLSERPYKDAWEWQKAVDYVVSRSGSHFDPAVVAVFLDHLADIHTLHHQMTEEIKVAA